MANVDPEDIIQVDGVKEQQTTLRTASNKVTARSPHTLAHFWEFKYNPE